MLQNGYQVLALDYSRNAINKCNELMGYRYKNYFKQFDLIEDELNKKFKYIYSIAVLHMFVTQDHRDKYLKFIYEHLTADGVAFITVLGDGEKEYSSGISDAFLEIERVVMNNNQKVNVATTSCRMVNWKNLKEELNDNGLEILKQWISREIPEFSSSMCVVVRRKNG